MKKSWSLAISRLNDDKIHVVNKELPPARGALKRMLLATIHGLYLDAMSLLPTTELCTRYHRSMLLGGYCYGPMDPVSNIIVNTVWYDQRYYSSSGEDIIILQMISTKGLWRLAARSLYGLVSFLCTRYPVLTPDLAMQRLLAAKADLRAADPNFVAPPVVSRGNYSRGHGRRHDNVPKPPELDWTGFCYQIGSPGATTTTSNARKLQRCVPSASVADAYAAAATAAFHPYPSAQAEFLVSPSSMPVLRVVSRELKVGGRKLSAGDTRFLFQFFRCYPSPINKPDEQREPTRRKSKAMYSYMCESSSLFWQQHARVRSMVRDALDAFNRDKELKYSVHVICGVNERVSGPDFTTDEHVPSYGGYSHYANPWKRFKFHHSHINFLATCTELEEPILFFAECSNLGTDKSWCVPVEPLRPLAEHVRCIYCERQEYRMIVHPAVKGFHGRDVEFEKVHRGEPLFHGTNNENYRNNRIITHKGWELDWVHSVRDEYIYSVGDYAVGIEDCEDDEDDLDTLLWATA